MTDIRQYPGEPIYQIDWFDAPLSSWAHFAEMRRLLGVRFTDNELAAALGIPLLTLRRIMPSRQEQTRALRQSGISLKEATHLMHLRPATLNRLATS